METLAVRILLVVNAAASSVNPRRRDRVLRHLSLGHDVDVVTTDRRGHATELAAAGVSAGATALAVLGGDGTVNEVAAALVGTDCVLAPLPGGSTNVFVRSIGLPNDAAAAAEVVGRALARRSHERIAVGDVSADGGPGRPFLCHVGIGWDAALVEEVERLRDLPARRGRARKATVPLFVRAGLRTFAVGWDRRNPQLHVEAGDGEDRLDVDGSFTLVQNGDPYTFVGPMPLRVAQSADRHGPLSCVTLTRMSAPVFLRVATQALVGGADGDGVRPGRGVEVRHGVESVTVTATTPTGVPYQVDGDHLGSADVLRLAHRPDALSVVTAAPD